MLGIIRKLGFVQLDSIQIVARAHHHILWSRNQNYRENMLNPLLARDRNIFEHFTHDASVIPMEFLPHWHRQFHRMEAMVKGSSWWSDDMPGRAERDKIKDRIRAEGALSTRDFDTKVTGKKEMWSRPPHKKALDFMWYSGELGTCYRDGFTKYYNLPERIFPHDPRRAQISDKDQVDWLCKSALSRIAFGSPGDIQRFWDAVSGPEVKAWVSAQKHLTEVEVQCADGTWTPAFAPADIETRIAGLTPPTSRLRILNPFDPVIRDRTRLLRLFGFDYRVEMFVPAAKRIWGYYVFPLLEADRFVGRIEVKADRKASTLTVLNVWPEPGIKWPASRHEKLGSELDRMRRFVGVDRLVWS